MENTMGTAANIFTLDTCVIREIYQKDYVLVARLKQGYGLTGSVILVNSVIRRELKRQGLNYRFVREKLERIFEARVEFIPISESMRTKARDMKTKHPTIHPGDDVILACVIENGSALVTCDRGFERAAEQAGVRVINPNGSNAQKEHRYKQRQRQKSRRRRGRHWIANFREIVYNDQRWQQYHS